MEFNQYYNSLVITTDYDVRVYNCYTGKLEKVFVDPRIAPSETNKIHAYSSGPLHRKYFIGDNKGKIECFNFANGDKLKNVNDLGEDQAFIKKFSAVQNMRGADKGHLIPAEDIVSAVLYLHTENRLIVGTVASVIKIYDESAADGSTLDAILLGGHCMSKITTFAYDNDNGMLLSGSENGMISVWDMRNAKYDSLLKGHNAEIVKIEVFSKFSSIVSSSCDGTVSFWGYIGISPQYYNRKCYLKLLVTDMGTSLIPITASMMMCGNAIFEKQMTIDVLGKKASGGMIKFDQSKDAAYLDMRAKRGIRVVERPKQMKLSDRFPSAPGVCSYLQQAFNIKDDQIEAAEDESLYLYSLNRQLIENYMMFKNSKMLDFFVAGDKTGQIHIYMLNDLLENKGLLESSSEKSSRPTPFKKELNATSSFKRENLNVTLEVQNRLSHEINSYIPHTLEANKCIRVKSFKAHQGAILGLSTIVHVK